MRLWPKNGEIMIRKEVIQKYLDDVAKPYEEQDHYDGIPKWIEAMNDEELDYCIALERKRIEKMRNEKANSRNK